MTTNDVEENPVIIKDLRKKLPEVRDQGKRPLCLVFATSDANSHANGLCAPLSAEYLAYYSYKNSGKTDYNSGLSVYDVENALSKHGQPEENIQPYDINAKSVSKPSKKMLEGKQMYYGKVNHESQKFENIEKVVKKELPVLICADVTIDMLYGKMPAIYSKSHDARGGHAMIVCGIGELKGEALLMVKNSWGRKWANNGYAWVTEDYVKSHVFGAQVIESK